MPWQHGLSLTALITCHRVQADKKSTSSFFWYVNLVTTRVWLYLCMHVFHLTSDWACTTWFPDNSVAFILTANITVCKWIRPDTMKSLCTIDNAFRTFFWLDNEAYAHGYGLHIDLSSRAYVVYREHALKRCIRYLQPYFTRIIRI